MGRIALVDAIRARRMLRICATGSTAALQHTGVICSHISHSLFRRDSCPLGTPATGDVQVKLGFVQPPNTTTLMEFEEIYSELVKRTRPSLVSAPPVRTCPLVDNINAWSDTISGLRVLVLFAPISLALRTKTMVSAQTTARRTAKTKKRSPHLKAVVSRICTSHPPRRSPLSRLQLSLGESRHPRYLHRSRLL